MQLTDGRSVSTLTIVGVYAAALVVFAVLLNILVFFLPFDSPAMGLLVVFGAAGMAASCWYAREKAVPAGGRAWWVALACGVISGVLSAALAVFGLSGDARLWNEFSNAGALTIIALFVAVVVVQALIARLGFWVAFRRAAKKAANDAWLPPRRPADGDHGRRLTPAFPARDKGRGANGKYPSTARQFRILGGYALACLTSAAALAAFFTVANQISRSRPQWHAASLLGEVAALTVLFIAPTIVAMTLLPAALFVWWSEKRAVRRFAAYAAAGMAMAVLGSILFFWRGPEAAVEGIVLRSIVFAIAGLVAGATYWRIAGRHAGIA